MSSHDFNIPSPIDEIAYEPLNKRNIKLLIKRDDLIHPDISGNKWRKLKLNIEQALHTGRQTLLTFGGAHSNHIAATAAAANKFGLKSIGIIRGEDADLNNPTLKFAAEQGMQIERVSREEFKLIDQWDYIDELKHRFGSFYLIPQGGANYYGVQGCLDIIQEINVPVDRIFVGCGTATTLSGMAIANKANAEVYGVSALKGGGFLIQEVDKNLEKVFHDPDTERYLKEKIHILLTYHFGGYAKVTEELLRFMRKFYEETGFKLDPVYTAKTAYAMTDLAGKLNLLKPETWVLVHTGGLQGIPAMEAVLGHGIY